jgi:hypothetical protein
MLSQTQAALDAAERKRAERDLKLAPFKAELVEKGEIVKQSTAELLLAPVDGAPQVIFDLVVTCHKNGCGTELQALKYHAFVNDSRFMLWIDGMCPKCMERRKTVFDPMVGLEAKMKHMAEMDSLWESWKLELCPEEDDAEPDTDGMGCAA